MQELTKALNDMQSPSVKIDNLFTEAAKKWAWYILENNTGKLAKKGLKIAQALVEYENELLLKESK
jgi:hypothetical protein